MRQTLRARSARELPRSAPASQWSRSATATDRSGQERIDYCGSRVDPNRSQESARRYDANAGIGALAHVPARLNRFSSPLILAESGDPGPRTPALVALDSRVRGNERNLLWQAIERVIPITRARFPVDHHRCVFAGVQLTASQPLILIRFVDAKMIVVQLPAGDAGSADLRVDVSVAIHFTPVRLIGGAFAVVRGLREGGTRSGKLRTNATIR